MWETGKHQAVELTPKFQSLEITTVNVLGSHQLPPGSASLSLTALSSKDPTQNPWISWSPWRLLPVWHSQESSESLGCPTGGSLSSIKQCNQACETRSALCFAVISKKVTNTASLHNWRPSYLWSAEQTAALWLSETLWSLPEAWWMPLPLAWENKFVPFCSGVDE